MSRAIVVGCGGQDGRLLQELLSEKRYRILGIGRTFTRCDEPGWTGTIDITDSAAVFRAIREFRPDEVYHLAAFHQSSEETPGDNVEHFRRSYAVNVSSLVNFLEGVRRFAPAARLFYAASSRIFGRAKDPLQDEETSINPDCIYGITKAAGLFACRHYRHHHAVAASVGILYNHESSYRDPKFVSKKIVSAATRIKGKKQEKLVLENLEARADWGYAPDYVEAIHRIVRLPAADDFVIATGESHSVLDFVKLAFGYLGLNWKEHVEGGSNPLKNPALVGNAAKLRAATGWNPKTGFDQMVKLLLINEGALINET
jgi:GDPmannose 4,6-dehydratase